uniref:Immunoglobulin subtype domain-containing protein n=1 Tax=Oncorhynchus tshawytscha TaxID=74940 RepID=A0AAZ3PZX8_ONCTS
MPFSSSSSSSSFPLHHINYSVFISEPSAETSVFISEPSAETSVFISEPSAETSVFISEPSAETSVFISEPSAETSVFISEPSAETSVFMLKGQDVLLNVQTNVQLQEVDVLFWKFNRLDLVVKYPPKVTFERYRGRAEFSVGDFSLLLKNIQDGDSGLYDAVVSGNNDRNVAKYVLVVQERVEPPVLTVDSVSSINGICNVTVTCRGQKTSVTSSCNNNLHCPPALCVCGRGSIICNHSNQVSWVNDTKEIVELCPLKSGKTQTHKYFVLTWLVVLAPITYPVSKNFNILSFPFTL